MISNNKVVLMQTTTVVENSKRSNYNRVKFNRDYFLIVIASVHVSRTLVDVIEAETIRTVFSCRNIWSINDSACQEMLLVL